MRKNGIVYLKGSIKSGVVGSAAFTLGAGYRPAEQNTLGTISSSAIGQVDVTTTRGVVPIAPSNNGSVAPDFRAQRRRNGVPPRLRAVLIATITAVWASQLHGANLPPGLHPGT